MSAFTRVVAASVLVSLCVLHSDPGEAAPSTTDRKPLRLRGPLKFEDEITVFDAGSYAPYYETAASGRNVYVMASNTGMNEDVFLVASNDTGATFGPMVNVSQTVDASWCPDFAAAEDCVYVAWVELRPTGYIHVARSVNGGRSFSPSVRLSASRDCTAPRVAAAGSAVYVLWQERVRGVPRILFRASIDRGATFGEVIDFTQTGGAKNHMVADGSMLHMVLAGGKYYKSSDHGATFSDHQAVPAASLAVSGGNVYAVSGARNPEGSELSRDVCLRVSHDTGTHFGEGIFLTDTEGRPEIAVDGVQANGNHVYVGWREDMGGYWACRYRISHDGGRSFEPIVTHRESGKNCSVPRISISGGDVYIAWKVISEEAGGLTITQFSQRSEDHGRRFTGPSTAFVPGAAGGYSHSILAHDKGVHLFTRAGDDLRYVRGRFGRASRPNEAIRRVK